jgi:hypothetical protein
MRKRMNDGNGGGYFCHQGPRFAAEGNGVEYGGRETWSCEST